MPEICRFHGIVIQMYYGDHPPPHFHARFGNQRAKFDIETLTVMKGGLPPRSEALVLEWARLRQRELLTAWARAQRDELPGRIAPLP